MDEKDRVLNRLSKVEGQIRGIKTMVSADREFKEILTQLSAARSGINRVMVELLFEEFGDKHGSSDEVKKSVAKFI